MKGEHSNVGGEHSNVGGEHSLGEYTGVEHSGENIPRINFLVYIALEFSEHVLAQIEPCKCVQFVHTQLNFKAIEQTWE